MLSCSSVLISHNLLHSIGRHQATLMKVNVRQRDYQTNDEGGLLKLTLICCKIEVPTMEAWIEELTDALLPVGTWKLSSVLM